MFTGGFNDLACNLLMDSEQKGGGGGAARTVRSFIGRLFAAQKERWTVSCFASWCSEHREHLTVAVVGNCLQEVSPFF